MDDDDDGPAPARPRTPSPALPGSFVHTDDVGERNVYTDAAATATTAFAVLVLSARRRRRVLQRIALLSVLALVVVGTFVSLLFALSPDYDDSKQPSPSSSPSSSSSASFSLVASDPALLTSPTTSSADRVSELEDSRPSFARKGTLINQVFVKNAWLWTTLLYFLDAWVLRNGGGDVVGVLLGFALGTTRALTVGGGGESGKGKGKEKEEEKEKDVAVTGDVTRDVVKGAPSTVRTDFVTSVLRWLVATFEWAFFAAWFFGPPLMERVLTATGGLCIPLLPSTSKSSSLLLSSYAGAGASVAAPPSSFFDPSLTLPLDPSYCRRRIPLKPDDHPHLFQHLRAAFASLPSSAVVGSSAASRDAAERAMQEIRARWRGGHDMSGHVFILTLSSLLLLEEVAPFVPLLLPASNEWRRLLFPHSLGEGEKETAKENASSPSTNADSSSSSSSAPASASTPSSTSLTPLQRFIVLANLAFVLLEWWMLLVTSLYYHTPWEKASGLVAGLVAWWALPKD